ncbi:hypothetical protein BLOT_013569, partial [Blomia tropicalis]
VYICNWFIMFTMIYYSFIWNTFTFISLETSLDVNLYPQSLLEHQILFTKRFHNIHFIDRIILCKSLQKI